MDISFRDNAAGRKLKKLLSDEKALKKLFGRFSENIQVRLDLLASANCLAEVPTTPPPRRHQLTANREELFAVDVKSKADKWRIEFEVANDPIPRRPDQGIDLNAVTAIRIIDVSNHYK